MAVGCCDAQGVKNFDKPSQEGGNPGSNSVYNNGTDAEESPQASKYELF